LGTTYLYYFLVISIWGYVRFFRGKGIDSNYWGMLAIAEILILAECLLGGYLWLGGYRPARNLHALYGLVIPLMIPGAYLYTKGRSARAEIMIYGTATIITVGLIVRAIYTAQIPLAG
jgi:hypothetical protein